MSVRTDLAIDVIEEKNYNFLSEERNLEEVKITEITVKNDFVNGEIIKPKGKYITIEFPFVESLKSFENLKKAIKNSLLKTAPKNRQKVLVVGLGNSEITADSVGPITAEKILATRHIAGEFAEKIGLKNLKSVSVLAPGVLGKTGIETGEIIKAVVEKTLPDLVILIDALATNKKERLFKSFQITNTGITPGSGVKNSRKEISEKTLKTKVLAIGIPTVVDSENLILTPKDADILNKRLSEILSECLNLFLQPEIDGEIILNLV